MIISSKQRALVNIAKSFVGVHEEGGENMGPVVEMFQRVIGKAEKEPWCASFVQYCVREVDKKYAATTLLYATESTQMLWAKTPHVARVAKPEPGTVVIWTKFKGDVPLSIGHCGIVVEVLDDNYMLVCEGNSTPGPDANISREGTGAEPDGVYLKRRAIRKLDGYMRTTGFISPWAV